MLASFGWLWLAWPDGLRPRSIGVWLAGYTAVMVVGGLASGGSGCAATRRSRVAFGLVATVSPIDWTGRAPAAEPGALARAAHPRAREGAVLAVLVGIALFDAVSFTQWWADLLGVRSLNGYTLFNTLGLAWLVVPRRWCGSRSRSWPGSVGQRQVRFGLRLVAPTAALAAGYTTAHEIGTLLNDTAGVRAPGDRPAGERVGPVRRR